MTESEFYTIKKSDSRVEIWSKEKLSFEPKGWHHELRDKIRSCLIEMKPSTQEDLYACLICEGTSNFDVENILFYNVGTRYLSKLAKRRIRFERIISKPIQPRTKQGFSYLQIYDTKNTEFRYWKQQNKMVSFSCKLDTLSSQTKPDSIWYSIKKGEWQIFSKNISTVFGIRLKIMVSIKKPNLMASLKPLLDGTIAASQKHSGSKVPVKLLAQRLGVNEKEVFELITNETTNIIGNTELVLVRNPSFQWNPSDDRLVMAEVEIEQSSSSSNSMTGTIFSIMKIS